MHEWELEKQSVAKTPTENWNDCLLAYYDYYYTIFVLYKGYCDLAH